MDNADINKYSAMPKSNIRGLQQQILIKLLSTLKGLGRYSSYGYFYMKTEIVKNL